MFLKSIEIRGFKSFADRTELSFKNGVTAVVGPNGSGKSNISDAVRWVLGEQSVKSLRGGKMEDVIFAGTQYRKPVGLAQVSLTLDNSDYAFSLDYSDITISRRLYRSGESEYYINNTQCRLKDIHELFMDTGIGKEGYSIIGQGKIEAILSGRPEDRRNLLEEAAGIVKFKSRKEEAERKLDNTEQNLVRINDILSTLEERLEPLRIENEKAKVFIELSEQLKTREITLILNSIDEVQNKLNIQRNDITSFQEEVSRLETEKNGIKEELQKWKEALEKHELQSDDDKKKYYDLKDNHGNIMSEITMMKERCNNLIIHIDKTGSDLNEMEGKIEALKFSKESMEEELRSFQKEKNTIDSTIMELEKSIETLNIKINGEEHNSAKYRDEEIELLRKVSEIKNISAVLQNNIDSSQKKLEQLNTACDSYMNSIKINVSTKSELEKEICKINNQINLQEEEIKQIKKEISGLSTSLSKEEQSLKLLTNEANRLDANYQILSNLERQYEGYNKAVKSLMQHIETGKLPEAMNNAYVLGNVITVDTKLEVAIEVALGGAISDIITHDEKTAKIMIKYLKDNNLGRATFLPLNNLQSKVLNLNNTVRSIKGFIGIASELIQYDEVFTKAIGYVLGRTIIASDMDSALAIAKAGNYSLKIVTLSGDVVNPGGSMTGGSFYSKGGNIIGRKREIEEIQVKAIRTKDEINGINEKINSIKKNIKELDLKSLNLRDETHYKHIEVTRLEEKSEAIAGDTEKLKQSVKISQEEIHIVEQKIKGYQLELKDKQSEIVEIELAQQNNKNTIEDSEFRVKALQTELLEFKDKFLQFKVKKAQIDEAVGGRIKELERLSRDLEYTIKKCEEYKLEIEKSRVNLNEAKILISTNMKNAEDLAKAIEKTEKLFSDNEIIRLDMKDKISKINDRYEESTILLQRKEQERHRYELLETKYETEKESLYSKLNDELKLTYAEAVKFRSEIQNMDQLKSEIITLKSKVSSLGIVNLGAIEEYEQTREKCTFMTVQKEDLIKAKNELFDVINEMTNKMREVFNENFIKLRENFNETFRELFKGGSADLILSDGDALTGNIEINVQPPGKKLQNINLMSGGEKGLSAIALLFAILKMKPTPFCILDEIEAALDDANVFRYAEFLKKFSEKIQFIVITHRKGTMEASDVLYGVTMEEKGVSKIVSVDLSK